MEGGRYRIDLELRPRIPILTDAEVRSIAERLRLFLPGDAEVTNAHITPRGTTCGTIDLAARSPIEALSKVVGSMEHLAINIRREHQVDPMGPPPVLVSVTITHAPEAPPPA